MDMLEHIINIINAFSWLKLCSITSLWHKNSMCRAPWYKIIFKISHLHLGMSAACLQVWILFLATIKPHSPGESWKAWLSCAQEDDGPSNPAPSCLAFTIVI